jgi:hypothetical protein
MRVSKSRREAGYARSQEKQKREAGFLRRFSNCLRASRRSKLTPRHATPPAIDRDVALARLSAETCTVAARLGGSRAL